MGFSLLTLRRVPRRHCQRTRDLQQHHRQGRTRIYYWTDFAAQPCSGRRHPLRLPHVGMDGDAVQADASNNAPLHP